MSSFLGNIRKEKEKATNKVESMMPTSIIKLKDVDESWKSRKPEVRKRRLRRVAHNPLFFSKRNAYRGQNSPKNLINRRNRLLEEARQLHIREIKIKNEKTIRKSLHIKQKGEFLKDVLKINRIELITRGEKALREILKKEVVKARDNLKNSKAKLQKLRDNKLHIASEGNKRRVEYMKNAERFIKEIIDNLRNKGIKKLNIDLITDKGTLKKGVTIDVEKKELLVKNPEVVRHLIKKSSYSKFIGKLSEKKGNLSIKADPKYDTGIIQPSESVVKENCKIILTEKKNPIKIMKFDSSIRSPIEARRELNEFIIKKKKSLNITKPNENKDNFELKSKSDIQANSSGIVKASSKISDFTKICGPKSLNNNSSTENQILKAKTLDTLKKDTLLNAKGGIPLKVVEKSSTSLLGKSPILKKSSILLKKDTLTKEINTKDTPIKEVIKKMISKDLTGTQSKDLPDLDGKAKSSISKASEIKKSPPAKKMNDIPNTEDLDQNKELTKTFSKNFPKAVTTKSDILAKSNFSKKVLPKQLGNAKPMIIAKKKSDENLISKVIPMSLPNTLEKDDYNLLIYNSDKYWSSRLYDLYRRMKGESSQRDIFTKRYLKKERRRLSTQSGIEKRRIKTYTRLRIINEAKSKGRRHTLILIKPGSIKRYGIPALMNYSYRYTNKALSSDTEQNYLVRKLSPNYTDSSHIEYILEDTNTYVFGIHRHHELLSIARNTFNEDFRFCRMSKLYKYALRTKMSDLEQFVEEVMGEMIINGDLNQDSRENVLENNIMRLRYLINTDKEEKQSLSGCKNKSDEANQLWDKLVTRFDLNNELNTSNKILSTNNFWKETSKFIYDEEIDLFKKVYYLSDLRELGSIDIDESVLESIFKSIRVSYNSQDFKFPFIFSKEIRSSKNVGYHRKDFISYVGKLSPWTKIALIQKIKKKNKSI
ncbi:hypothetical protein CHM_2g4220 [Cryptosporidium hominis]